MSAAIKSITTASSGNTTGTAIEAMGMKKFTAIVEASTGTCSVKLQGTIGTSDTWVNITPVTTFTTAGGVLNTTVEYALTDVRAVSSTVATTGGIAVWVAGA